MVSCYLYINISASHDGYYFIYILILSSYTIVLHWIS